MQDSASQPPASSSDLDVLEEVISEVESSPVENKLLHQVTDQPSPPNPSIISQALPTAVTQVADQVDYENLNPPTPVPSGASTKEKTETTSPDSGAIEAAQAIQYIEHESHPEIPPEVDGFLKRAQDYASQAPQEIVVADGSVDTSSKTQYPSQPVVVLPITEKTEQKAKHKNTKFSIRWLVEWSHKIMKKFVGKIIYREA